MDPYTYMNSVLDDAPSVVKLALTDETYAVAIGPVPDGQPDLKTRVTLEGGETDQVNRGYDADNNLVVQFRC